jgi:hypothetical protein
VVEYDQDVWLGRGLMQGIALSFLAAYDGIPLERQVLSCM